MMRLFHSLFIGFVLLGCSKLTMTVNVSSLTNPSVKIPFSVQVEQALSETIGSCNFQATTQPTNSSRFSYKVTFSKAIDPTKFDVTDIINQGTGGTETLDWSLENCGDDTNFKLTALEVEGNGTIEPFLADGLVSDSVGNINLASTSSDNSVDLQRVWYQEAYIKASNNRAYANFGEVVSLDGETLVVGTMSDSSNQNTITPTASTNTSAMLSGAAYVYRRTGSNWVLEAYIKASNNQSMDQFAASISLSQNRLAVGSEYEDSNYTTIINGPGVDLTNTKFNSGAVFVYRRTGSTWVQEAFIKASNANSEDIFGSVVSLNKDTLAVGASYEDSNQSIITNGTTPASGDNSLAAAGAVYVYRRTGNNWAQEAYIKSSSPQSVSRFGDNLSLSNDTLAVSANRQDVDGNGNVEGAVFIYRRTGVTWAQEAYFTAVNIDQGDAFGVAVSVDDDSLAVGSMSEQSGQNTITNGSTASADNSVSMAGAVYVYKRIGTSWVQESYIKASNVGSGDGYAQVLSLKGDTLAVSADSEDSGQTTITNGPSAALDNTLANSGAVYVYRRKGTLWSQEAYIKAANANTQDGYGIDLSLSGDTLVVGANREDSNENFITNGPTASNDNSSSDSGAVYVYRYNGRLFNIDEIWGSSDSSSITLNWNTTGGIATGYIVAYANGPTPPATCSIASDSNLGIVGTYTLSSLTPSTQYSFRVCATDGVDVTKGETFTMATTP